MADHADLLTRNGIDYDEAMDRFEHNAALYERLALKFLNDPHFDALELALSSEDAAVAYQEAHSLKGVAGNLSFGDLHKAVGRVTDALRTGDLPAARALMEPARRSYASVIVALKMMEG